METQIYRLQIVKCVTMEMFLMETDAVLHVLYNQDGHVRVLLGLCQFVQNFVETVNGNLQIQRLVTMGTK